jgi:hypothetical protein
MRRSNPYVNRVSIGSKTSLSCASWGGRSFLGTLSAALSPYERRTSSGPGILFPPTPLSYASIIRDMRAREKMWPVLFKSNLFVLSFQSCESVQANCQSRGAQSQNNPPLPLPSTGVRSQLCAQRLFPQSGVFVLGEWFGQVFLRGRLLIMVCISHTAHGANANANANAIVNGYCGPSRPGSVRCRR